jgi:hypothetical protein
MFWTWRATVCSLMTSAAAIAFQSGIVLLDGSGTPVPTGTDPQPGPKHYSVTPAAPLVPGPYTVAWTSRDATDGHDAAGSGLGKSGAGRRLSVRLMRKRRFAAASGGASRGTLQEWTRNECCGS